MYEKYRHRSRTFILISWLVSRLWLGIELSRLTMLRSTPAIVSNRNAQSRSLFVDGGWLLQQNRFYFYGSSESSGIVVRETTLPELN